MKIGDLVQAIDVLCSDGPQVKCPCWFCETGNTRIGTVLSERYVKISNKYEFDILFGSEIYTLYNNEAEVINESR